MWVKICANTCAEDAVESARLGADALGFVFAPSKREVHAPEVRAITEQLPAAVERVGVFTDMPAELIALTVRESGLTAVQLHGRIDLEKVQQLRSLLASGIEIIHSVHWAVAEDQASEEAPAGEVRSQLRMLQPGERVLVDAKVGNRSGGLGVSFDWDRAAGVLAEFPDLRFIIAGGLRPETVADAVRVLKPYGVDVASGVERVPGRKELRAVQDFIENARRA